MKSITALALLSAAIMLCACEAGEKEIKALDEKIHNTLEDAKQLYRDARDTIEQAESSAQKGESYLKQKIPQSDHPSQTDGD